ncbi:hypothetical protein OIV83_001537 [Microbotryomycetes sp. JL201]|nr:hypothetical protein OIV83_001537 [Microbotryomycetes sp. JL201]
MTLHGELKADLLPTSGLDQVPVLTSTKLSDAESGNSEKEERRQNRLAFVDRQSLGNASIFGLITDNHLLGYMVWELPANLLLHKFEPVVLTEDTAAMVLLIAACHNFAQLAAVRCLMGAFESAVTPGLLLVMSDFYTTREQASRVLFWSSGNQLFSSFCGVITFLLGRHAERHPNGLAGWQLIHIVLGSISIAVSVVVFFQLGSIDRVWWLNTEQKEHVRQRVIANKTNTHRVRTWSWHQARECLYDPQVWLLSLTMATLCVPNGALSSFIAQVIRALGFTSLHTVLLQIPLSACNVLAIGLSILVDLRWNNLRLVMCALWPLVTLSGLIVLLALPVSPAYKWHKYAMTLLVTLFSVAIFFIYSLVPSNIAGRTKKTVVSSCVFVAYCVGNACGGLVFKPRDAPRFHTGLIVCMACLGAASGLAATLRIYQRPGQAGPDTSPEPADEAQSLPVILSQLRSLERDQAKASTDLARLQKLVSKTLMKSDPAAAALHGLDQQQRADYNSIDGDAPRYARSDTPMSDVSELDATINSPDFVGAGLIPASLVPDLIENYYKCIATRIAFLLPIPSFDKLPPRSILRNTALTLALRTLPGQDMMERFAQCITRLGRVLHAVHTLPPPATLNEHHDRVHAMALYSVFMSDLPMCRKTIIEAMDAGLHRSRAVLLTMLKSACANKDSVPKEDLSRAMYHFDLWLSTLTVDNFLTLYLDVPPLVTMVDRHDAIELVHFMFKEGVATPWLVVAGAYSQMSSLVNIGQNDLATYRRGSQPLTAMDLSRLRTVLSLHDQWIERTTQSRDAERGALPGLTIAAALGQLSCMRCCFEPVDITVRHQRSEFLKRAVGAAEHLMQTALNSELYRKALRYSIEFVFYNSFTLVHQFCVFAFKHISDVYDFRKVLPSLKMYHELMRANFCAPHRDDMATKLAEMGKELDQAMEEYEAQSPRSAMSGGLKAIPIGLPGSQIISSNTVVGATMPTVNVRQVSSSTPSPGPTTTTHVTLPTQNNQNNNVSNTGHSLSSPNPVQNHRQQQLSSQPQTQTTLSLPPSLEWNTGSFDFFSTSNLDLVIDSDWLGSSSSFDHQGAAEGGGGGGDDSGGIMFDENAAAAMIEIARGNSVGGFGFGFEPGQL